MVRFCDSCVYCPCCQVVREPLRCKARLPVTNNHALSFVRHNGLPASLSNAACSVSLIVFRR
jgi:hypothetical protein